MIDIQRLGDQIAATVKEQQTNSPSALKQRIAELEKQSSHGFSKEREQMLVEQIQSMEQELERYRQLIAAFAPIGERLRSIAERLAAITSDASSLVEMVGKAGIPEGGTPARVPLPPQPPLNGKNVVFSPDPVDRAVLSTSNLKILTALAKLHAIGVTSPERVQVAFFSGYSNPKSGGFAGPMAKLTELGLTATANGCVSITREGLKYVSAVLPASTEELHENLRSLLGTSEWKLLEILIQQYPRAIGRTRLADRAGYSNAKSGGFAGPLARLTSLKLAEVPSPGMVSGTSLLFVGGGR